MGGQQHCLSMCRWAWGGTCAAGGSATGPAASPARGTLRPQLATPEARGKKEFEKCASQLGICSERAPTIHRGCSVWGGTSAPECPMLGCGDALRGVSMSKELVVSATPHETRVAILEDG